VGQGRTATTAPSPPLPYRRSPPPRNHLPLPPRCRCCRRRPALPPRSPPSPIRRRRAQGGKDALVQRVGDRHVSRPCCSRSHRRRTPPRRHRRRRTTVLAPPGRCLPGGGRGRRCGCGRGAGAEEVLALGAEQRRRRASSGRRLPRCGRSSTQQGPHVPTATTPSPRATPPPQPRRRYSPPWPHHCHPRTSPHLSQGRAGRCGLGKRRMPDAYLASKGRCERWRASHCALPRRIGIHAGRCGHASANDKATEGGRPRPSSRPPPPQPTQRPRSEGCRGTPSR